MKTNELFHSKRKQDISASHYRINLDGLKVQLMASVEGERESEKNEFLMCQVGFKHAFIVASLNGFEDVKLFTLKNYIKREYGGRYVPNVNIPFSEYINPDTFMQVVGHHFITLKPQSHAL
ncbi:hypothetical protein [Petrimonas sp.]|uniref:hypothetical protein n=1 Tax=Petrimonas sp. TaxID=2023866 RepID=UPI003F512FDB